jgi:hypothetical protein
MSSTKKTHGNHSSANNSRGEAADAGVADAGVDALEHADAVVEAAEAVVIAENLS